MPALANTHRSYRNPHYRREIYPDNPTPRGQQGHHRWVAGADEQESSVKCMTASPFSASRSPLTTGDKSSHVSVAGDEDLRSRFEREAAPLLRSLYGVAHQLTPTPADAEDLLQDTMVKAYSAFRSYEAGTHLKAWLVRIMRNTWIDQYRARQCRPTEWLTDDVDAWEWLAYGRHGVVEHESADTSAIRRALSDLPVTLHRAVYFAYFEELPHKDIAELERIPLGTVMSRLHRARQRLRASLAKPESGLTPHDAIPDRNEKLNDLAS
jgi:RNA polymerase sigma-70 factor (ECF subfamily)